MHITTNPVDGVSLRRKVKPNERMLGFTDAEAAKILEAACYSTNSAILWPPLLCATSGARLGEMAQLRGEGLIVKRGIPALRITAEAGSVKYDNSERTVPIHPTVLAAGFMGFVESQERTAVLHPRGRQQPEMTSFGPSTTAPRMSSWGGGCVKTQAHSEIVEQSSTRRTCSHAG